MFFYAFFGTFVKYNPKARFFTRARALALGFFTVFLRFFLKKRKITFLDAI